MLANRRIMKKEELIKKLQELPKGTEVCIMDWRKNLHHADDEPQGMGIEKDFDIEYHTEDVSIPFAGLVFENDDYQTDGTRNYDELLAVVDCQFLDSYGTPVKHGDKIIIEANYNYQRFNNREALVEWYPEKGMYRFVFTDDHRFTSRHDFYGIHSFKVVQ